MPKNNAEANRLAGCHGVSYLPTPGGMGRWYYLTLATILTSLTSPGCVGYQLGSRSLFNPNIRTIHVPVVRNDTFRDNIGVHLTEAVQKTIELRTPYKVVGNPNADSTLTCRVSTQTKRPLAENRNDEPRILENLVTIELTWTDRQGNLLMENRFVPPGEIAYYFAQGTNFVPEGGQSYATTEQRIVEQMAAQIVNQMEARW